MKIWKIEKNGGLKKIHFEAGFSINNRGELEPMSMNDGTDCNSYLPHNPYQRQPEDYYQEFYTIIRHYYKIPVIATQPIEEDNELRRLVLRRRVSIENQNKLVIWPAANKDNTPCLQCWKKGPGNFCTRHNIVVYDDTGKWPPKHLEKKWNGEKDKEGPCVLCFREGYMKFCPLHEEAN